MAEYYSMKIAGLERNLEKFPVNEHLDIAAFIIFGDVDDCRSQAAKTGGCIVIRLCRVRKSPKKHTSKNSKIHGNASQKNCR